MPLFTNSRSERLKLTPGEQDRLDWCYQNLTEEEISDCQDEAMEFAAVEVNAPTAYEALRELLVKVIVRNAQERGVKSI
jgi:hypothetical protein